MSTQHLSRLVVLVLGGTVLVHCALGIAVVAAAGRFAWAAMAHDGSAGSALGGITARLAVVWLGASVVGLLAAVRLVRAGRLSL